MSKCQGFCHTKAHNLGTNERQVLGCKCPCTLLCHLSVIKPTQMPNVNTIIIPHGTAWSLCSPISLCLTSGTFPLTESQVPSQHKYEPKIAIQFLMAFGYSFLQCRPFWQNTFNIMYFQLCNCYEKKDLFGYAWSQSKYRVNIDVKWWP